MHMRIPAPNVAVFPGIEGNLEGIDEVRLEIQIDSPKVALDAVLNIEELRRRIEATLKRSTLIVNPVAPQALVVGVCVEPRDFPVPTVQNQAIVFFVSTALREVATVSRTQLGQPTKRMEKIVDSWCHKGLRGFAPLKTPAKKLGSILFAEVDLQVDEFIAAWRRDSKVAGFMPPSPAPLDPLAGLRCLRVALGSVELEDGTKTETITIVNPPPAENSTIQVKFKQSVTAELFADICGPSALIDGAQPLLTASAQAAAAQVTLPTMANDPAAATAAFRTEFLTRLKNATGPMAVTPAVSLSAVKSLGRWELDQ
jgi:hypothetical protein